ncbi:uncharacterized protein J3R85_015404 [Psidium guajava]|nr:uncharacterized protein J3R85_015404 [Psidium guajava]
MAEKSKVLVIGGTGNIGTWGQVRKRVTPLMHWLGRAWLRMSTSRSSSEASRTRGFAFVFYSTLHGDIYDHESLVTAIKQVDVVILAVGGPQLPDQVKIIAAIKEAGNIKRFLPSEFGTNVDHNNAVEPAATLFGLKAKIRRAIEAEGIPFTYVASNGFAGYFLPTLGQMGAKATPRDKITIIVVFVKEEDIATHTIKAVDDPRTLNKILYLRPPATVLSFSEIVSLWEKKIGTTLDKTYLLEDELLKKIQESPLPINIILAITHSAFVKGDATNYEIDALIGAEASQLYPEVKYTTVDEYLSLFVCLVPCVIVT